MADTQEDIRRRQEADRKAREIEVSTKVCPHVHVDICDIRVPWTDSDLGLNWEME